MMGWAHATRLGWGPTVLLVIGLTSCSARPPVTSPPAPTVVPTLTPTLAPPTASPTAAPTATPTPIPTPTRTPGPVIGIELHELSTRGGLTQARDAGAHWVRFNGVVWSQIEPREGGRNWTEPSIAKLEQGLREASALGLEIILVVRGTPTWAQALPGYPCGPIEPSKLEAFGRFMFDLVARYSAPPFNVTYWEIWNEPDAPPSVGARQPFGCWGVPGDDYYGGKAFAQALMAAYPQARAADANAQVLVGGLLLDCDPAQPPQGKDCTPARFLEGILEAGGGDSFDGVAFHAYDYYLGERGRYANPNWASSWDTTGPVMLRKAQFLRAVLEQHGYEEKYLVNTETALLCGASGKEAMCLTEDYEATKAFYIVHSYAQASALGLYSNIWFSLTGWRASGLVTHNLQPNPAYHAMRFASQRFEGATFVREITGAPHVGGYEFARAGERFWIVWSLDGEEHPVELPAVPSAVFDTYGEALPLEGGLTAGVAPVYAVWAP